MPISQEMYDRMVLVARHLDALKLSADTAMQLVNDIIHDPEFRTEDQPAIRYVSTVLDHVSAAVPTARQLKAPKQPGKRVRPPLIETKQTGLQLRRALAEYLDTHPNPVTALQFFAYAEKRIPGIKKSSIHTLFFGFKGKKLMKSNGDGSYTVSEAQREKIREEGKEQEKAEAAGA